MSKRANGEGNIRQRPNGKWEGRITYLDPATDKRRSVSVYADTATACRRELKKVRDRLDQGQPAKDSPDTVAAWMGRWRESSLAASSRKATTKEQYSNLSRKHLEAEPFGALRLDKLKPSHVEELIVALRAKGLADSSVRSCYTVLRQGLDVAVRDGLIAANPAAKVKRPTVARKETEYLSAADVAKLLEASKGLRYHLAVLVMAATGLRRGEVAGLTWSAVDLDRGELAVLRTVARIKSGLIVDDVKTERSRRRVPLPPRLVAALKAHRKTQLEERLHAGDQWCDTGAVFATEFGGYLDPRNLLRTVEIAAKKAGIGKAGAHTMRHSAATAWLESGVHIKAVSDLLGHSSIAVTADVYGHTSDDTARAAVADLAKALGV